VIYLNTKPLLALSRDVEAKLISKIQEALSEFHRRSPLLPGISKQELHTRLLAAVPDDVFAGVLERAVLAGKLRAQKDIISLHDFRVRLSSAEEAVTQRAEESLIKQGLNFTGIENLAKELRLSPEEVKQILHMLARENRIIKVDEDYFLHRNQWIELKEKIHALKSTQRTFSVPDFKALFGVTRKYAIPLLERLDREGVTRRSGNERIII
jgi:selenocysteine-specific elongation factor